MPIRPSGKTPAIMRIRTPIILTSLALAAAAVVPADAAADKRFTGKSQQGRTFTVTTGDDNVVKEVRTNWLTRRCSQRGTRFQHRTRFIPAFDFAAPGAFRDAGKLTVRDRGGIRSRVTLWVNGKYDPVANRWAGSIHGRIVVRYRGRTIDRCTLRRVYWSANAA